ncbi:PAP2 superfamily protein [Winogradskyella epiphytica]|uniref:PAP2 superfamily protein n=1 Tax=Winogradskyella epiphytica TaxID=262005 RepID=A0A2V4XKK1_9FLAO|nr:phosphatase PAP2 family protein [Winogradskyella epiphytica]PYE82599.1 PAP2 superfamily protein [Winogradskyella epiphytica]
MKKTITLLAFVISMFSFSQTDSISENKVKIWESLKYDTKVSVRSIGNAFTQPLRWKSDDFITAGGVLAGTGLLYLADNEAHSYFLKQNKDVPNVLKEFGWYFGSPQNFFMVTTGVYGYGLITDNEKVRKTGILIISGAVTTGIIQSLSKTIVGRARPKHGPHDEFSPFSSASEYHSFPSGHAILTFTMAHAIAKQFDSFWTKAGIYAVGSIAPISRLWADAHWISDVGLGMALSIIVVDGIDNFMKKQEFYDYSKKPKTITWNLQAGFNTIGIVGSF